MLQDQKKKQMEGSVNSTKTDEFSIINGEYSKQQDSKISEKILTKCDQESVKSEYQENRSNSLQKQPLAPIAQSLEQSEYESEQIQFNQSLQESYPPSEIRALHLRQKENQNKPIFLNIMVAGQSGLGKSTFVDVLLKKKLNRTKIIRDSTLQIQVIEGKIEYEDVSLNINFIDTPGYRPTFSLRNWIKLLTNYLKEQHQSFHRRYEEQFQSKQHFQQFAQNQIDERVHVCFYFFQGPRILDEDLRTLKKLSTLVNIIPILAKGDSYTKQEIMQIKNHFSEQILEYRIDIFNCKDKTYKSNFGPIPPYVIITSIEQFEVDNKMIYGRQFPWGICDIFNPLHSDLQILYKQLLGVFFNDLVKITEYYHNQYVKEYEKKKQIEKKNNNFWNILYNFIF